MEEKDAKEIMNIGVAGAIVIPGMIVLTLVFHGWVFSKLWGWFAVTVFGARTLSLAQAVGVSMLAYPVKSYYEGEDKRPDWRKMADPFFRGFFVLLCGYVVSRFI